MMPPRRPAKGSHLRQVSSASVETTSTHSTINSQYGSKPKTKSEATPKHSTIGLRNRACELWVHDDSFSREEILFNSQAFHDAGVKVGDLVSITSSRGSRDASGSSIKSVVLGQHVGVGSEDGISHAQSSGPGNKVNAPSAAKTGPAAQARCLFLVKPFPADINSRHPNLEVSVSNNIANAFGFKNRCQANLSVVDRSKYAASHVEIVFRDQFLVRADMWRLVMSELYEKPVYQGQKIMFLGSIKATIRSVRVNGQKSVSGYFSPQTRPVFRSESARYVLFIQMSREMWDFDSEGTGDILFSRVINGFLPELFKRWAGIDAKHLVTLVLFTRVEYETRRSSQNQSMLTDETLRRSSTGNGTTSTQDFYRVVVNDMASGYWTTILDELKREFRTFLRDVCIQQAGPREGNTTTEEGHSSSQKPPPATISGHPSSALRGNILEAINIASSQLAMNNIDRDMIRTGTSIVVITPGTGVFEVDYESLAWTSEFLTSSGIAIDLVCLSPMPLHSTPLFKYRKPIDDLSRSNTSISRDSHLRGSPPPLRPGSGSFSSRKSHLSKSVNTNYGSMTHSLAKFRSGAEEREWGYGVPHWVDISFWNASAYQERRKIMDKQSNVPIPWTISRQSKMFIPRVRMYEIQMMGVMESEQSNISIPYLSESHISFRDGVNHLANFPHISDADSHASRFLNAPSPPHRSHISDGGKPESFLLGFKNSRRSALSARAKPQDKMLEWMDEYDSTVFRPFKKDQTPVKHTKSRHLVDSDTASSRFQSRRSLSLKGRESFADEQTDLTSSNSTRATMQNGQPQLLDPKPSSPKGLKPPEKPSMKSASRGSIPRISRSISFALRGLGSGPPRAVASTEINAEHAVSDPALNRKTSEGNSESAKGAEGTAIQNPILPPAEPEETMEKAAPKKPAPSVEVTPSRPISIKIAQRKMLEEAEAVSHRGEGSFSTTATDMGFEREPAGDSHRIFAMKRMGPRPDKPSETDSPENSTNFSPSKALAPWIRSVNPSNEQKDIPTQVNRFGRWQHVHPRKPNSASVKWKSLKSPAILPLTMEELPTPSKLATDYVQTPYRVFQNDDPDISEVPKSREVLVREMIALRLSHGFQIVVGPGASAASGRHSHSRNPINVFDTRQLSKDGTTIFMSLGNVIHRIVCVSGGEIEVTKFRRKALADILPDKSTTAHPYTPAIRTILSKQYDINSLNLRSPSDDYNWNSADAYIAGHRDHLTDPANQLRFWRIRFVLIPVRLSANMRRPMPSLHEDNEEEVHLLGINQLTSLWQRHRYVPAEEKRLQSSAHKRKDQNPLDIMYQTRNPSEVVAAELDRLLLADPSQGSNPAQLLPDSELLQRSDLSLSSLGQIIQGEKGVRMMDRRWHWRLHYNCFIGLEFTTWLLRNFRDIDTREEAVEFGNELMSHGLFQHVEKRHNFRDGNYFYQIASEHRVPRQEAKSGWFPARKTDKSVPSTPLDEGSKNSPSGRAKPEQPQLNDNDTSEPKKPNKSKVAISLSKSLKYDLDPRKRSNRPEVVDLHYDRLHNPDNCFHIELSWMNATPKLLEDALASWASTADKFGLKLVEVPINEASTVTRTQGFRKPYLVKLKLEPPKGPIPLEFVTSSFTQQGNRDKQYYQKAILKKFDFVLDFEAWSAFPPDVDVSYSWGKPDYHYPQYIHRSGCILAQILDDGSFLLVANRLSSHRSPVKDISRFDRADQGPGRPRAGTFDPLDRASPYLSPFTRPITDAASSPHPQVENTTTYHSPEQIKDQLEAFCSDVSKLEKFYSEGHAKSASFKGNANVPSTESSIPSLELPDSVVVRHISPPPNLDHKLSSSIEARMQNKGSPRQVLGPTP